MAPRAVHGAAARTCEGQPKPVHKLVGFSAPVSGRVLIEVTCSCNWVVADMIPWVVGHMGVGGEEAGVDLDVDAMMGVGHKEEGQLRLTEGGSQRQDHGHTALGRLVGWLEG